MESPTAQLELPFEHQEKLRDTEKQQEEITQALDLTKNQASGKADSEEEGSSKNRRLPRVALFQSNYLSFLGKSSGARSRQEEIRHNSHRYTRRSAWRHLFRFALAAAPLRMFGSYGFFAQEKPLFFQLLTGSLVHQYFDRVVDGFFGLMGGNSPLIGTSIICAKNSKA